MSPEKKPGNINKKFAKALLRAVIGIACIGLIVYYFRDSADEIKQIQRIGWQDIAKLFVSLFLVQAMHSYKLFVLLRLIGLQSITFVDWFRINTVSRFVNQHVFQGAALYRFIKLKQEYSFSYSNSIGLTLFFTYLEVVSMIFVGIVIIAGALVEFNIELLQVLSYLCLILAALLLIPVVFIRLSGAYRKKLIERFPFVEAVWEISKVIYDRIKTRRFILIYAGVTFLFIFTYMFTINTAFKAIGIPMPLYETLLFTLTIILSRMFTILPANIGISEVICGAISRTINVSFGSGVIVAGIVRIINYTIYGGITLLVHAAHWIPSSSDKEMPKKD